MREQEIDRGAMEIRSVARPQDAILTPDLRFTLVETATAKAGTETVTDAVIVNNATMARCTLAMMPTISTAFGPTFLPGSGQLFWGEAIDPMTLSVRATGDSVVS